jgi:hypothetical protein
MMPEEFNEVVKVVCVKSPVFEVFESIQLSRPGIEAEIIGAHIHFFHQLPGFINNGFTVPPGENGSKERSDLNVLFFAEQVRDGYWVIDNERLIDVRI